MNLKVLTPNILNYQIYHYLLSKINSKELSEGNQRPDEMILCNVFYCCQAAIREALRKPELNGYMPRINDKDTFKIWFENLYFLMYICPLLFI